MQTLFISDKTSQSGAVNKQPKKTTTNKQAKKYLNNKSHELGEAFYTGHGNFLFVSFSGKIVHIYSC